MTARDGKSFSSAAMSTPLESRPVSNSDGRAWREAKARIIDAAQKGNGVRLTPQEAAEAAAEFGEKQ